MSEDLIKRSDAIAALNREKSDWNCDYNVPIDNCIKRLNKVKSADRPQEWIPCSERLPEDAQIGDEYPTVIFCTKENTYAGLYEYCLGGRWWAEDGDYVVDDVIAWMPLPEPWKGADDADE